MKRYNRQTVFYHYFSNASEFALSIYFVIMSVNNTPSSYSVPAESRRIFLEEILQNPLVKNLPPEVHSASAKIKFTGSDDPSIAINWKFAESIASLKAFEGAMLGVLLQRKYGVELPEIVIDT